MLACFGLFLAEVCHYRKLELKEEENVKLANSQSNLWDIFFKKSQCQVESPKERDPLVGGYTNTEEDQEDLKEELYVANLEDVYDSVDTIEKLVGLA